MADILAKIERPCAIYQKINTGHHFNGTEPTSAPVFEYDIFTFAAEDAGGKIDPTNAAFYAFEPKDAQVLLGIELKLGGQTAWSVELEDANNNVTVIASGTNESSYVRGSDDPPVLLWGTKIAVKTSGGAPTGLHATIKLTPYKTYQG